MEVFEEIYTTLHPTLGLLVSRLAEERGIFNPAEDESATEA